MPHTARRQGEAGFYHFVPKGESDRVLFEDDADRQRYVDCLAEAKSSFRVRIHAYVLMSNHVHLILESEDGSLQSISNMMRQVNGAYAMYFKEKAGRSGKVFRSPLWSEPIESEAYLLRAVRYVHANPALAGICKASAYRWSSVGDYLGRPGIADTQLVLETLGGREGFIRFSREGMKQAVPFPDSKLRRHLSEEEAHEVAVAVLGRDGLEEVAGLPQKTMISRLEQLEDAGLSVSQISRFTGVPRTKCSRLLGAH